MKGGGRQRRFEGAGKLRPEQMKVNKQVNAVQLVL